jgi:hypothetical protein
MLKKIKFLASPNNAHDFLKFWPTLWFLAAVILSIILFFALSIYPQTINGVGLLLMQGELSQIISPVTGTVEAWYKEEGETIKTGEMLALVRHHKDLDKTMVIKSNLDGVVAEIIAYSNSIIHMGEPLAFITKHGDPQKDLMLVGFVSSLKGKMLTKGMPATIEPSLTDPLIHGQLLATVKRVGKLPMTKAALQSMLKIPEMAKYVRQRLEAEPFVVVLSLNPDSTHKTGYLWNGPGPLFLLDSGIFADFSIVYDEPSILALLWPSLKRFRLGVF